MVVKDLLIDFSFQEKTESSLINTRALSYVVQGRWASLFKGKGIEFENYRQYSFSDDASKIDWPASLRSNDLLVREYLEFKQHNVFFLLDVSDSMLFGSTRQLKAEYGADLSYALANSALQAGDAVGIGLFADGIVDFISPKTGIKAHKDFKFVLSNKESYGGKKNFERTVLQLDKILPNNCILVVISDFFGFPDDWHRLFAVLNKKNVISTVILHDERDMTLPKKGLFTVKDPFNDDVFVLRNSSLRKKYSEESKDYVDSISRFLKINNIDSVFIKNGLPVGEAMMSFFSKQIIMGAINQ